jgi:hypothetical protein
VVELVCIAARVAWTIGSTESQGEVWMALCSLQLKYLCRTLVERSRPPAFDAAHHLQLLLDPRPFHWEGASYMPSVFLGFTRIAGSGDLGEYVFSSQM